MNAGEPEQRKAESIDVSFLDLFQMLELFVALLSEQAWRYMGLRVDPRTNEVVKDFEKAHVSIECIIAITDKVEQYLSMDAKNRIRSLITDLQINYAHQLEQK